MKKLSLSVGALIVLLGLGGLYVSSMLPKRIATAPTSLPTQEINTSQPIGGVVEDSKLKEDRPASTQDQAQPTTQPPAVQNSDIKAVAPKQAEIVEQTPTEYPYKALRTSNDPLPQPAWALSATKAQTGWDRSTGNGVVVAVIDSGYALNHEDLQSQWYQNLGETGSTSIGGRCWTGVPVNKSTNNCDDDNNGYRDDWRGWDFANVDNSPQAGQTDPNGDGVAHGTQVAGLVGAAGNNGAGTATLSWNNRIMPLQALGDDGSGFTSGIAAAVYYATDNGAKVINMSLGGPANDPTLAAAIAYAYQRGVVVVAAAGNCGTGGESGCDPAQPGAMGYPALNPYVISVGATNSSNIRASFSSYGPGLDIVAPGSGSLISPMWLSANQTSAYSSSLFGTSFASPFVASLAGLIKSLRPSSTVDDITALLAGTASKPAAMSGSLYTSQYGHGIIDAEASLRIAESLNSSSGATELRQTGGATSEHSFTTSTSLASGCKTTANTYCTVWARDDRGFDRYLPYTLTNGSGDSGWAWSGSTLSSGNWNVKARSGDNVSTTPYQLFSK